MLFSYTYVPHQMDKMQLFIDFIFQQVWCNAPQNVPFSLDLFAENAELHEVMLAFHFSDAQGAEFFLGHVERIYALFAVLTPLQIEQFQRWYQGNNDLEKVCACAPEVQFARYPEVTVAHEELGEQLASFFKGLYSQSLLSLAALREKIGTVSDHYQAFVQVNNVGKCPFCGIADLQGEYHSTREAYDHYLPKSIYPFNSINFRNLVPACHHCNSSYKTSKDPAYLPKDPAGPADRRKAFYPFSGVGHSIELAVSLRPHDIWHLAPEDVTLHFGAVGISQEIETWMDVYGIEERYKAKLCSESDGKYWLTQILDEWQEDGKDPADFLIALARQADKKPFADCNFLKKPFLEACKAAALF